MLLYVLAVRGTHDVYHEKRQRRARKRAYGKQETVNRDRTDRTQLQRRPGRQSQKRTAVARSSRPIHRSAWKGCSRKFASSIAPVQHP
jgi:hypothetical protein